MAPKWRPFPFEASGLGDSATRKLDWPLEVDYRGDEVSVENFLRLLTGEQVLGFRAFQGIEEPLKRPAVAPSLYLTHSHLQVVAV